ncbi:Gmc oxidoreductase [Pandoravirus kuranda]|uniref:Gmc oxidoreductase n=1 Tax=Pandoravirus kuranda TaxID=3019033 RepID=A0AA95EDF6_9VIRU|nr:Gmc oxidoreductase [Pandoravirus kuranda]
MHRGAARHQQPRHAPTTTAEHNNNNIDPHVAVYDYIVVGAGAAGSAHARALSDDPAVSVLVLDWGPDRRSDPMAADLLRGAEAAHDPGTSIRVGGAAEPGLLGTRCALGGGRAVGGSTLVDSALWGTGGPREWRDFAKACKRAGPKHAGASVWMTRLAAAASVPLARVESYVGPCDAPLGGAPSSSSTASAAGPGNNNRLYNDTMGPIPAYPRHRRHHWDPGGDGRRLFVSYRDMANGCHNGVQIGRYDPFQPMPAIRTEDCMAMRDGDDNRVGNRGGDDDGDGYGEDDVPDWPVRGARGRVTVRALAPAWDALSDSFVKAAGRVYGVREVVDHNGPSQFGVTRHVQFAVRLGPPHGFNRQPAGDAFVGRDTERERCISCGRCRRLVIIGGALVERVVFETPSDRRATRGQGRAARNNNSTRPARARHNGHRGDRRHNDEASAATQRPRAVGVIYLERGVKPIKARARCRVVLCASALTPTVLQRSGIGDPRLLAGIGTPVVFANPAVGAGYHCPYGFRMVASVTPLDPRSDTPPPDVRSDLNPPGTVGMVFAQDATRPSRRRRQWCVLAAAGPLPDYWPVAGDPLVRAASHWAPFGMQSTTMCGEYRGTHGRAKKNDGGGNDDDEKQQQQQEAEEHSGHSASAADAWCAPRGPGPAVITLSAWLLDPTSRGGAIETPSSDPSVLPRARLGLYTDSADMQSMRALARSVVRLIDTMPPTPDGHRLTLAHPTPEVVADDAMLDLWLRTEAFYVAHRHGGVCRVGTSPEHGASNYGVVDGLLRVHGVDGLSVCDSTVFDHGMGVGTTAGTAAILATAYAGMLLDGTVDGACTEGVHPEPLGDDAMLPRAYGRPLPSASRPTARRRPRDQQQQQPQPQPYLHNQPPAGPAADRLFVRIVQQPPPPPPPRQQLLHPPHAALQPQSRQQRRQQRQEDPGAQHRACTVRPNSLRANQHPPGRSAFAFVTAPTTGQDDPRVAPPVPAQRRRHR